MGAMLESTVDLFFSYAMNEYSTIVSIAVLRSVTALLMGVRQLHAAKRQRLRDE
jgi:hypothetical protein